MIRVQRAISTTCLLAAMVPALLHAENRDAPTIEINSSELSVDVLDTISFDVYARPINEYVPWLWAESLPRGARLIDSGEGYREFSWTPDANQAGLYTIRLIAADAIDQTRQSDLRFSIDVSGDIDDTATPRIQVPASIDVLVGENVSFRANATLQQGVTPGLISQNLPQGAELSDNGDTTRQFNWQTDDADLGIHEVSFRAIDPQTLRSTVATVLIRVNSPSLAYVDVSSLSATDGFTVVGSTNPGDFLGQSVSKAGDVNGDGLDDIIIGAPGANRANGGVGLAIGAAYVLFGTSEGFADVVDVASLNGSNGFAIVGRDIQLGESVSHAGDLNGDGVGDVLVGEPYNTFGGSTGRVHVIYGRQVDKEGLFNAEINVQELDGSNGFTLHGLGEDDSLGIYSDAAGDFNGDGIDDIILGSPQGFFGPPAPGRAYLIYGRTEGFPASWTVQEIDGNNGFEIVGTIDNERVGRAVSGIGDINADGIDDIVVSKGANNLDGTESTTLRAHVLFGRNTNSEGDFPATIFVSEIDGYNGFAVGSGNTATEQVSAMRVSGGVDINADGIDDLILGEPGFHSLEGRYAGQIYALYGRKTSDTEAFPYKVDVLTLAGDTGLRIMGTEQSMGLGTAISGLSDINGDGIGDLVAKTSGSNRTYVLYGRDSDSESVLPARISDIGRADGFVLINVADTNTNNFSHRVSDAGDINGDGIGDMIIGSPNGVTNSDDGGEVYVIYGTEEIRR